MEEEHAEVGSKVLVMKTREYIFFFLLLFSLVLYLEVNKIR